jgi:hypothetical protein
MVRSVPTTGGGSFQTMRIGRRRRAPGGVTRPVSLLQSPSVSPVESLRLAMLQSFNLSQLGLRLSVLAAFLEDAPRMLGHSAAFDDSIACLVHCHGLILRGQRPADHVTQGNRYAKALRSLQAALTDPVESYSDLTLAAVTILGNVEIFGGGSRIPENIQHAGGATKLIEMRGPSRAKSNFAKVLYRAQLGQGVRAPNHNLTSKTCVYRWRHNDRTASEHLCNNSL